MVIELQCIRGVNVEDEAEGWICCFLVPGLGGGLCSGGH